ncbi:MAG: putative ABC exporter domain-containing protein [Lachnospiraceae bacterium]|nr:putative ABC exporter domain-containing protein [Lachnospiraceae bacterium]
MRLWTYYAVHTFVNSIKKMFRSKVIIVFVAIVAVGLIFGLSAGAITSVLMEEESSQSGEQREGYGEEDYGFFDENGQFLYYEDLVEENLGGYDENGDFIYYEDAIEADLGYYNENGEFVFYYEEITETDINNIILPIVESVCVMIILLLLFIGAYSGIKNGSDIFLMADVNFLFTAPIKPQSVLLFRLTFQMLATFAGCFYLIFQIPNLVINLHIEFWKCIFILLAFIFLTIFQKLVSVGVYTYTATHEKAKKYVVPMIIGSSVVLIGIVGSTYLLNGQDIFETLHMTLASKWTRLIPIVGWLKGFIVHTISGNMVMLIIYGSLNLISMAVMVFFIWHMKADFYEDALAGAQARADMLSAAAENRKTVDVKSSEKKKGKRKVKEQSSDLIFKKSGAVVFFTKELLCRKRLAKFGIITTTMMWYFTICVGMVLLNRYVFEVKTFTVLGFLLMVILFFRNYGNPIAQETSMNWLFLVPENPYKKVFFAMLAGTYATAMDLLPGIIFAMFFMQLPIQIVGLWFFVLLTMDFMLSGVGMMLEALFPATAMDTVKASIQLMLKFVAILFIVGAIVIGVMMDGMELGLWINLGVNIVIGAIAFVIYPSMLHDGIS